MYGFKLGDHSDNPAYIKRNGPLRFCRSKILKDARANEVRNECLDEAPKLMTVMQLLLDVSKEGFRDKLGRVYYSELDPGFDVTPHADVGPYFDLVDRVHIYLSNNDPRITVNSAGKMMYPHRGDVWRFDLSRYHYVKNLSDKVLRFIVFDTDEPLVQHKKLSGETV
jgi:hypothetical protein